MGEATAGLMRRSSRVAQTLIFISTRTPMKRIATGMVGLIPGFVIPAKAGIQRLWRKALIFKDAGSRISLRDSGMTSKIRVFTVALVFAFAAPIASVQAATGDAMYAHPGRLVNAGPTKLNFYCTGSGSPTVVFDAGWEDWSPAWATIQPAISRYTRTCTYDRAGSGFSEPGPMPRTSVEIAKELHIALHNAGIPGPYLLVGHSFGGYNIRTFADLYMPEVYGEVFVDIDDEDIASPRSRADDKDAWWVSGAKGLIACRNALANHHPLPTMASSGSLASNTPCSHQFFRGFPMKEWSPQLNAAVLHIASSRVALYDAAISEAQEMPDDTDWLITHRRSFGNRPLRILTAMNHDYDNARTPPALHAKHQAAERKEAKRQRRFLSLSTNAKQILVPNSGHYIQIDQPQIVIDAILGELPKRDNGAP